MSITDGVPEWSSVLDGLEREVTRAEAALLGAALKDPDGPIKAWLPPSDLGPIPGDLVSRAHQVQARQLQILGLLRDAETSIRRQQAFLAAGGSARRIPAFVDRAI